MRTLLLTEPTTTQLGELLEGLHPSVDLVHDDDGGSIDVLVGGRPDPALLERTRGALVVPYAGLPATTRERLLLRPELPVYNLHHNAEAVAELAVGLLIAAARRVVPMDSTFRTGDWRPRYAPDPSVGLGGHNAVIIGYGAIGRRVGRVLSALGMTVHGVRRRPEPGEHGLDALPGLLAGARAVVVALPATPETRGLLDARLLGCLPPETVLVNVGRASVVDEEALYEALAKGHIHGAGLDCWWDYPATVEARAHTPPSRLPFAELDSVVLSPHRAGHGAHVEQARMVHLRAVLNALATGEEPRGRVDVVAGY